MATKRRQPKSTTTKNRAGRHRQSSASNAAQFNSKLALPAAKATLSQNDAQLLRFVEDLKRQWMSTIDALVDPLSIIGKDYKIRKANLAMAKQGDLDVKAVVGKNCYEVFAQRQSPCPGCMMLEAAKKSTPTTYELGNIRGQRFFEVTSQPLFDSQGELDGVVQIYRDRTEAKRLHEQLAQQEKLASIGLLAGGVAHEINNPLGGILIFSQMLLREMPKKSPHYQDVVEIEEATQRCKAIVESLLDFARQRPTTKNIGESINIIEALRTAVRFGKVGLQGSSRIDISDEIDANSVAIASHNFRGDRNRLVQLFLNLIQNAVQAMPDGGTLIIRASERTSKGQRIGVYEIEDTGVGIAPENLKKIFDPFFTTKDPGEGTGLGLALCYGIVQDFGGTLRVESTINVGSRFFVEIPLTPALLSTKPAS